MMKKLAMIAASLAALLVAPAGLVFAQQRVYDGYRQPGSYKQVYTASPKQAYQTGVKIVNNQGNSSNEALSILKSPETILKELEVANKIPAEISPTISIQNAETLNASTNGQTIIITSGLMNRLRTGDQEAFVISHELSHIVLNHIAKTQFRRVGLSLLDRYLLRRYVAQGGLLDMATQLGINLYDKRYSRVYEYQADDLGIQMMARAGFKPQAAIEVFQILQAATPGNRVPEFLQDHPITDSRIRLLVQKYNLSMR